MTRVLEYFGMTAACALMSATPSWSAPQPANLEAQQEFHIPSQSLDTALLLYSRQSGMQIISSAPVVANRVAPSLNGLQSRRQALETLLRGSDLSFVVSGSTVTIVPASSAQAGPMVLTAASTEAVGPVQASRNSPVTVAQLAPPTQAPIQPRAVLAADAQVSAPEEVVVTGSRVIKNGNNSPTPLTVVSVQEMQAVQPSTLGDNLNELPVFSGSRSQTSNPNPAGGAGAANELNLRNLGTMRNLILLDGNRVPPTLTDGTVDIDMIPQLLVQRVDLVTGGVSAVYGSDAISGVVNFVLDKTFNGLKLQTQAGISAYGDDAQQEFGIVGGTKLFDGRGHFEASYEYRNDAGIRYRTDRPWDHQWDIVGAGSTQSPFMLADNVRLSTTAFGGLITSGALSGQYFGSNGVLSPFDPGAATGAACCSIGGDGAYYDGSMKAPLQSHQLYARFDYDLTENIHAYADFSGNIKRELQYGTPPELLSNGTFSSTNAFLSPTYQAQLAAAKQTTFKMSEFMAENAPQVESEVRAQQFFANVGLQGKLLDYSWNISYVHGWTTQSTITHNAVNADNLSAAMDAVTNPATGQAVCNVTLTNPGLYPGCAPLNLFGPTAADPNAVSFILGDGVAVAHTTTEDVEGGVSGDAFSLWAGPVSVALSGEWRDLSYSATNSLSSTALTNCTGLRYNCTAGAPLWSNSGLSRNLVSESVWETAAEIDAPLLKDLPFVQAFNVNAAVRYTSYSTVGDYITWKVGVDWHVDDALTLRATESRDIRAPTLSDLYSPTTVSSVSNTDYLTGVISTLPTQSGGDPNLKAEIGHTTTAGFVWRPKFLSGFSLSLDAYHILIDDALYTVQGNSLTAQQACYSSGGTSSFCALQTRPFPITNTTVANTATKWFTEEINIADIETYGADLELNYATRLFGRALTARMVMNYEPHLLFNTPGLLDLDHAGVAYSTNALYPTPVWAAVGLLHYQLNDSLAIDLLEHWRAPLTMKDSPAEIWANPNIASFYTTNLNLTYSIPRPPFGHLDVFLNIANLFNAAPPAAAYYNSNSLVGLYGGWAVGDDPVGRYFTLGAHFKY